MAFLFFEGIARPGSILSLQKFERTIFIFHRLALSLSAERFVSEMRQEGTPLESATVPAAVILAEPGQLCHCEVLCFAGRRPRGEISQKTCRLCELLD